MSKVEPYTESTELGEARADLVDAEKEIIHAEDQVYELKQKLADAEAELLNKQTKLGEAQKRVDDLYSSLLGRITGVQEDGCVVYELKHISIR